MIDPIEHLRSYLEAHGRQLTRERETVARTIFAQSVPGSPEQVARLVSAEGISRATVYRTFKQLEEAGVLPEPSARAMAKNDDTTILSPFCSAHHPRLVFGTCRWCGCQITDGEIDSGSG